MTPNQLRQSYLDFFKDRGHVVVPSTSLVPQGDPTTLFTGSGMQPMMPYLLGKPHPQGKRIVDSQRCFRAVDIEEVGDNRHTTYFEMLGNWSFGDYFKKAQLEWFFEFLVQVVGLDPQKLYVTVCQGDEKLRIPADEESVATWQKLFSQHGIETKAARQAAKKGMQSSRIFYYSVDKNWWSRSGTPDQMPLGEPGGPSSEVFYDFGTERQIHEQSRFSDQLCHPNCDCGRFLEIGNSVFMTYFKDKQGFKPLDQKNIDFGGGFERILAAKFDQPDIFQTTLFTPIVQEVERVTNTKYQGENRAPVRIITDHLRAATFLILDEVRPANKEQGYVLRRLLRRSAVKAWQLAGKQVEAKAFGKVVAQVLKLYDGVYTKDLKRDQSLVESVITKELQRFSSTLTKGMKQLLKLEKLDGQAAFDLYQTYGFPPEISQEVVSQQQIELSSEFEDELQKAKTKHSASSRQAGGKFRGGLADQSKQTTQYHTATHLLHSALRLVLGKKVVQKGSNITASRLRFDFTHSGALTDQEKTQVEELVNGWIEADLSVQSQSMPLEQALESGALALFGERYPEKVNVYTIGDDGNKQAQQTWVSREICGGPHVKRTGELPMMEIFKEKASSAGVRRIYMRAK